MLISEAVAAGVSQLTRPEWAAGSFLELTLEHGPDGVVRYSPVAAVYGPYKEPVACHVYQFPFDRLWEPYGGPGPGRPAGPPAARRYRW